MVPLRIYALSHAGRAHATGQMVRRATDHVDDDASQQLALFWRELVEHVTSGSSEQRERHGQMVVLQYGHVVVDQRQLRPCAAHVATLPITHGDPNHRNQRYS